MNTKKVCKRKKIENEEWALIFRFIYINEDLLWKIWQLKLWQWQCKSSYSYGLYFNINGKNLMIYQNQVTEYVPCYFGPPDCSGGSYEFNFDCYENFVTLTICLFLYFSRYFLYSIHGLCIILLSFCINCKL